MTTDTIAINAIVTARDNFITGFRQNRNGNYWTRLPDGTGVTVYRKWGRWHWATNYSDGTTSYSERPGFEDRHEAMGDVAESVIAY